MKLLTLVLLLLLAGCRGRHAPVTDSYNPDYPMTVRGVVESVEFRAGASGRVVIVITFAPEKDKPRVVHAFKDTDFGEARFGIGEENEITYFDDGEFLSSQTESDPWYEKEER